MGNSMVILKALSPILRDGLLGFCPSDAQKLPGIE